MPAAKHKLKNDIWEWATTLLVVSVIAAWLLIKM